MFCEWTIKIKITRHRCPHINCENRSHHNNNVFNIWKVVSISRKTTTADESDESNPSFVSFIQVKVKEDYKCWTRNKISSVFGELPQPRKTHFWATSDPLHHCSKWNFKNAGVWLQIGTCDEPKYDCRSSNTGNLVWKLLLLSCKHVFFWEILLLHWKVSEKLNISI